jgi:hypothetical protein
VSSSVKTAAWRARCLDSYDTAPSVRSTRLVYRLAIWHSFGSCVVEDRITLRVRPEHADRSEEESRRDGVEIGA